MNAAHFVLMLFALAAGTWLIVDALIDYLRARRYWRRYHALREFCSRPRRPFPIMQRWRGEALGWR